MNFKNSVDRQSVKKRDYSLDLARAVAISLVIFGHETTYPREIIRGMIYSFHMPLFFILSGIVFGTYTGKEDVRVFLKKKVKGILLPALFFEIIMYLWEIIKVMIEANISVVQLLKRFLGIFLQIQYSDYTGALWFLPCMFLCQICLYSLYKINRSWIRIILVIMLYIVAYTWGKLKLPFLPWALDVVPIGLFYMYIGVCIRNIIKKFKILGVVNQVCVIIFLISLFVISYFVSNIVLGNGYALDVRVYGDLILNTVCAISASLAIIFTCSLCAKRIIWLEYIGQNSMAYYGLQGIIVGILNTILWKVFPNMIGLFSIFVSCISLIISLCVDTVGVEIYRKTFLKFSMKL